MKKWLCALSICAVTGLGVFGFAGCGDGDGIASISVKSVAETNFLVGDVLTPTLSKSVFTVEYNNGRKCDLPMSIADIVYINYGDNSTTNKFVIESPAQSVVVRYKGKTTSYSVKVEKGDLNLNYSKNYTTTYDGTTKSVEDLFDFVLPDGVFVTDVSYRIHSETEISGDVYDATPIDAGVYDVKVKIDGGAKYKDLELTDITFAISKAKVETALANTVKFANIYMEYGDNFDLTQNWLVGESASKTIFASALKQDFLELASNIKYYYRDGNSTEYKAVLVNLDGNYDLSGFAPGEYVVRAYAPSSQNFNSFYYESVLTVASRELKYGEDYTIDFVQGLNVYEYTPNTSLMDIQTKITTSDPSGLVLRLNFTNEKIKNLLDGEVKIFYSHSTPNQANWTGETATMQKAGDYKIRIEAKFQDDICYFDKALLGVNITINNA